MQKIVLCLSFFVYFNDNTYSYSVRIRLNSNCSYLSFGQILQITIRYIPNYCIHLRDTIQQH